MLSRWTEPTITTPPSSFGGSLRDSSTQSQFIQPLGPSSFIKKTTEVVVEPRSANTDIDKLISDITITSDTINERPMTPVSPKELLVSSWHYSVTFASANTRKGLPHRQNRDIWEALPGRQQTPCPQVFCLLFRFRIVQIAQFLHQTSFSEVTMPIHGDRQVLGTALRRLKLVLPRSRR